MTGRGREQVVERGRHSADDVVTLSVLGQWFGAAMGWGVAVDTSRAWVRPSLEEIRDI